MVLDFNDDVRVVHAAVLELDSTDYGDEQTYDGDRGERFLTGCGCNHFMGCACAATEARYGAMIPNRGVPYVAPLGQLAGRSADQL